MFQDFKELLAAFNDHKVKYLIIGGYAVGFHAEPRATKDIDILIGNKPKNAEAAYAALKSFGAPLRGIKAADLTDKDSFFRIGAPPIMIDLLSAAQGVAFEKAWSRREQMTIDKKAKLKVWVVSLEDLLASKIAAGRPQDLADIASLRAANEIVAGLRPKSKKDLKPS